jgi:hypothetical protein
VNSVHVNGSRQHLGGTQLALLRKAAGSPTGQLIIDTKDNSAMCAVKRLVKRGLLTKSTLGARGARFGMLIIYTLTEDGRTLLRRAATN